MTTAAPHVRVALAAELPVLRSADSPGHDLLVLLQRPRAVVLQKINTLSFKATSIACHKGRRDERFIVNKGSSVLAICCLFTVEMFHFSTWVEGKQNPKMREAPRPRKRKCPTQLTVLFETSPEALCVGRVHVKFGSDRTQATHTYPGLHVSFHSEILVRQTEAARAGRSTRQGL